jgi:hypothetical protein
LPVRLDFPGYQRRHLFSAWSPDTLLSAVRKVGEFCSCRSSESRGASARLAPHRISPAQSTHERVAQRRSALSSLTIIVFTILPGRIAAESVYETASPKSAAVWRETGAGEEPNFSAESMLHPDWSERRICRASGRTECQQGLEMQTRYSPRINTGPTISTIHRQTRACLTLTEDSSRPRRDCSTGAISAICPWQSPDVSNADRFWLSLEVSPPRFRPVDCQGNDAMPAESDFDMLELAWSRSESGTQMAEVGSGECSAIRA